MKELWNWKGLTQGLSKYKYVLLVAAVGVLLLLLPSGEEKKEEPGQAVQTDLFQLNAMEEKLEQVLSQVEGAGRVTVALTLREGPRQVLAQDGSAREGDREVQRELVTVVLSKGGGSQEAVSLQQLGPVFRGAVVVSEGAEDPRIRLALSDAVSALTGLGADKISICKGK